VLPFGNEIDLIRVSGKNLREQLEHSVANYDRSEPPGAFLQMSGKYNFLITFLFKVKVKKSLLN
jgi:2',3'-cyclic-nucleotide 2'-phosphodiesterase (5'-nucleotidase family)